MLEEVVTLRLVFPRATESAERDAVNRVPLKVQINDGGLKRSAAVVVAFHREDMAASGALGSTKDGLVREIATRNQHFGADIRKFVEECFVVCDHEESHTKWCGYFFRRV